MATFDLGKSFATGFQVMQQQQAMEEEAKARKASGQREEKRIGLEQRKVDILEEEAASKQKLEEIRKGIYKGVDFKSKDAGNWYDLSSRLAAVPGLINEASKVAEFASILEEHEASLKEKDIEALKRSTAMSVELGKEVLTAAEISPEAVKDTYIKHWRIMERTDPEALQNAGLPDPATATIEEILQAAEIELRGGQTTDAFLEEKYPSEKTVHKWERIAYLTRKEVEEGGLSPANKAELEALMRPEQVINIPSVTGREEGAATAFFSTTEYAGELSKEDQAAYLADLSTEAKAIQRKEQVGYGQALRAAHRNLKINIKERKDIPFKFGYANYEYKPAEDFNGEKSPEQLKEGESGVFGDYEFRRQDGKLQRRLVK